MQKTKLGISVGLLGAIACFTGYFGSYLVSVLIMGYVLLMEENEWLKKTVVKVMLILVTFSAANAVIGLIPDAINLVDSLLGIFKGHFSIPFISSIVSLCRDILSVLEKLIFLLLGFKAFNQGTVKISFIDRVIDKQFAKNENV